jgi:hypothetical protein
MMSFGQHCVTHLNQPGQIRASAEASVNAQYNGHRVRVSPIVGVQAGQPLFQGKQGVLSGHHLTLLVGNLASYPIFHPDELSRAQRT